jgi:putative membrane protein
LPSTSSSAELGATKPSATETLAARYRHLFVLPRTATLVASIFVTSLLLSLTVCRGAWAVAFVTSSVLALLSASAVSSALRIKDRTTIATFRRTTAVLFASQVLWLLLAAVGAACSLVVGSNQPLANATLFGAFTCTGFEFLVISGVFTKSFPLSAALAIIHPLCTFLVVWFRPTAINPSPIAIVTGVIAFGIIFAFIPLLRRRKTSRGHNAVSLFQAFMKAWTSKNAADLEAIIQDHAESTEVTTKVMKFRQDGGDVFIVLPGVHPGPFFPVGSYNLPGVISSEFKGLGPVLTLHRPGGHERNLASNDQTRAYGSKLREFAGSIEPSQVGTIRGPVYASIGGAVVSSTAFAGDVLLTISFAPRSSDDLEPRVEDELSRIASDAGFHASVVDAHNSISKEREHPDTADLGWKNIFDSTKGVEIKPLRVAYAHSSEVDFSPGDDITQNGVGLLLLEGGGAKSVLILADANNAAPRLREESAAALKSAGYNLIELCTSDSHDLAAKGLTVTRGYMALGESTPIESIKGLLVALAELAETRLAPCRYGSGQLTSAVKVFGSRALEEFASIAQSSTNFAKRYSAFATASALVLFALSLVA